MNSKFKAQSSKPKRSQPRTARSRPADAGPKSSPRSITIEERLWAAAAREVLSPVTLGIAHDLNNQLTGILSVSDLCLREAAADDPIRHQLEIIHGSGERAAALVRALFIEHQAKIGRAELHDLNALAKNCLELTRWAIPKSITTTLALASEPLPVKLDAVAFRAAFLHLALNAAAAVPEDGSLEIRTLSQSRPPRTAHVSGPSGKRPWAGCALSDTGCGFDLLSLMPSDEPPRKTKRAGIGLGLCWVERFVRASGGAFAIEPRKIGTAVSIWFPKVDLDSAS